MIKLCVYLIEEVHNLHRLCTLITIMSKINNSAKHDCYHLIFFGHDRFLQSQVVSH